MISNEEIKQETEGVYAVSLLFARRLLAERELLVAEHEAVTSLLADPGVYDPIPPQEPAEGWLKLRWVQAHVAGHHHKAEDFK